MILIRAGVEQPTKDTTVTISKLTPTDHTGSIAGKDQFKGALEGQLKDRLKDRLRADLQAHKAGRASATKPTRLDQLATKGIASAVDINRVSDFGRWHGLEVLDLATDLLRYSPAQAKTPFGQANFQKLFGALLTYQKHFAADRHWQLVAADIASATLRWRCTSVALPDVVDSVTRTSRLAAASAEETPDPASSTGDRPAVVRECDLTNPKSSLLTFPNERRTVTWCVADDPIHMRADAFPHLGPSAVHVSTVHVATAHVTTAAGCPAPGSTTGIEVACDQLDGRWVR